MIKHKKDFLSINRVKSVKVEEGTIEVESYMSYTKKYHDNIPCSYAYKTVCIDDRFSKLIVVYRSENAPYEFIKAIFYGV